MAEGQRHQEPQSRTGLGPGKRRCAVVGHPVAHSLSPEIHRAAYARLGLDWDYQRVDVAPGALPDFVASLDESWRGLSVTMPHKEDAALLGASDAGVCLTGVANTIVLDGRDRHVHNTDIAGFRIALTGHGIDRVERGCVLGNGATARSALAALADLGAQDVQVIGRSRTRVSSLTPLAEQLGVALSVHEFGERLVPVDLLISTVPAHGLRSLDQLVGIAPVIFDAIYNPWPTPLGQAAAQAGRLVLNGLDLLAGQAVDQVRWFTGSPVAFEVARSAAQAGLKARR